MDELVEKMKVVLADTIAFGMKAHFYHWNVEGEDFFQYHKLFELIYEEVEGAVDSIGEEIRALDAVAPLGPRRVAELTTIEEATEAARPTGAAIVLLNDNARVLSSIMEAYRAAERYSAIGLSNFLQDRFDIHNKHQYMLRSSVRNQ
jgi:starvation-inducible DNA-binding protein